MQSLVSAGYPSHQASLSVPQLGLAFGFGMVVEHRGFRGRWQSASVSAAASHEFSDDVDMSNGFNEWEPVELPENSELFALPPDDVDGEDDVVLEGEPTVFESKVPVFMRPRPKSATVKPSAATSESLSVKRTADEMASMQVHKIISDVKQPWQLGPLASLFSKPKPFWEQRHSRMPLVGLSDHIAASSTSSSIPKPIQQTELTIQRIRASRLVSSQDDYRHLALSRFKTMVLLDLDCTRLGQSLRSFAGTLCPDEELCQIFMDVFAPKATGTILKRCNALWRFSCWLQKLCYGSPFCQDEKTLYRYICHLRDSGAGPTTPSQFVEALRFADTLLGFTHTKLSDMLSARVTGAAHSAYMTKRVRNQPKCLLLQKFLNWRAFACLTHTLIAGLLLGTSFSVLLQRHVGMTRCTLFHWIHRLLETFFFCRL